jgi:hypothetical protein
VHRALLFSNSSSDLNNLVVFVVKFANNRSVTGLLSTAARSRANRPRSGSFLDNLSESSLAWNGGGDRSFADGSLSGDGFGSFSAENATFGLVGGWCGWKWAGDLLSGNNLVALNHLFEDVWCLASVHLVHWARFFGDEYLGFDWGQSFSSDWFADALVTFVGAFGVDVGVDSSSVVSAGQIVDVFVA